MTTLQRTIKAFNKYDDLARYLLREENRASLFFNEKYYKDCCKYLSRLQDETIPIIKELRYYGCKRE